jgi:hypothetical protein
LLDTPHGDLLRSVEHEGFKSRIEQVEIGGVVGRSKGKRPPLAVWTSL